MSHELDNGDNLGEFDQCDAPPAYIDSVTPLLVLTESATEYDTVSTTESATVCDNRYDTESEDEEADISDDASSLSDTRSLPVALGYQFIPDGREDVSRFINGFFPCSNVAYAENMRATAVANEFGGVTLQFNSANIDSASGEADQPRESWNHTNDHASLVNQFVQHYGSSNLPHFRSSSSKSIEQRDGDTNTDLSQIFDIEAIFYAASKSQPSVFKDSSGTVHINGGNFIQGQGFSYYSAHPPFC